MICDNCDKQLDEDTEDTPENTGGAQDVPFRGACIGAGLRRLSGLSQQVGKEWSRKGCGLREGTCADRAC